MCAFQDHGRRHTRLVGLLPAQDAQAPAVVGLQPCQAGLGEGAWVGRGGEGAARWGGRGAGQPTSPRRRSTTVICPLVSMVARSTSCACRQPPARSAASTSSRVSSSLRISAWFSSPWWISTWALPSTQRPMRGKWNANRASATCSSMSVLAEISPPTSELSPAFIEFCTAFDRISNRIRSNGSYCPVCRLPDRRMNTSKNRYTTTPRSTNSHHGTLICHIARFLVGCLGGGSLRPAACPSFAERKSRQFPARLRQSAPLTAGVGEWASSAVPHRKY